MKKLDDVYNVSEKEEERDIKYQAFAKALREELDSETKPEDSFDNNTSTEKQTTNSNIGLDFDIEYEKSLWMLQAYPCMRKKMQTYVDLIEEEIIGQTEVVSKVVYIAYLNQYLNFVEEYFDKDFGKRQSLLLIAPTGNGKTALMRAVEKNFEVPVHIANISATTSAGYIGAKVEDMLVALVKRANGDVEKAQNGILFIDEIDKKTKTETTNKDVSGKAVQQELLRLLDEKSTFELRLNKDEEPIQFKTDYLTVFLGGAFEGLDEIRDRRLGLQKVGFLTSDDASKQAKEYKDEDLINFGLIPELVGRIDNIQEFRKLEFKNYMDIIYLSKNSRMTMNVNLLKTLGVEKICIDDLLWTNVVNNFIRNNLGVRTLNSMIDKVFEPIIKTALNVFGEGGICNIDASGGYTLTFKNQSFYGEGLLKFNE